jgi:arylsulfatase A-like enzyme
MQRDDRLERGSMTRTQRNLLAAGALLVALALVLLLRERWLEKPLPSAIVLITLDTTRADHLGAYGYAAPTSPALDALARQGVRVEAAISPMPTTDPAHISILTGLYPRTHGIRVNGVPLQAEVANLGSWARRHGFRTAAFVSRKYTTPDALNLAGFEAQSGPEAEDRNGHATLTDAFEWLDRHEREPYFLWVHLFEPHLPYAPPGEFARRFVRGSKPPDVTFREATGARYSAAEIEAVTALYDGEIAYMDALIGSLLRRVAASRSEADAPLIIVVGDHGEALGELDARHRFAFGHGAFLYQGVVRVPLILVWRGHLAPGGVVDAPVDLVDIPATVFDLVGREGFATQGESFLPLIDRPVAPGAHYAFSERRVFDAPIRELTLEGDAQYAVQDERYKLILTLPDEAVQLYDLAQDPDERRDRASELPEVRARLRGALDDWLAETRPEREVDLTIPEDRVENLRALGYID